MIDQVLAREVLLGHRAVPVVLVADVAVEIDLGRHHELGGQVDVRGAGRHLELSLAPHPREAIVLDEERRPLDRRAAVAGDEQRPFVHRDAVAACLPVDGGRPRRHDQPHREEPDHRRLHSPHERTSNESPNTCRVGVTPTCNGPPGRPVQSRAGPGLRARPRWPRDLEPDPASSLTPGDLEPDPASGPG
jgi:hypothetical protein